MADEKEGKKPAAKKADGAAPAKKAAAPKSDSGGKKEAAPNSPAVKPHPNVAIREKLNKIAEIEKTVEAPLKDVLELIADHSHVPLLINEFAFKDLEPPLENVGETRIKLSKMENVTWGTVLRMVLAPINGVYLVKGGYVEITTRKAAFEKRALGTALKEFVNVSAKVRPLVEVLGELAEDTGVNIVIDPRTAEKAQTFVTANLQDVPLDSAIRTLANMADLKVATLDNVFLVTTAENADQIRQDQLRNAITEQAIWLLQQLDRADEKTADQLRKSLNETIQQLNSFPAGGTNSPMKTVPKP